MRRWWSPLSLRVLWSWLSLHLRYDGRVGWCVGWLLNILQFQRGAGCPLRANCPSCWMIFDLALMAHLPREGNPWYFLMPCCSALAWQLR